MPFAKGQSGNPGGRPKGVAEVREAAQAQGIKAIQRLAQIMMNKNEDSRACVAAAKVLLERGYGKPEQPLTGDAEGGPLVVKIVRFGEDEA